MRAEPTLELCLAQYSVRRGSRVEKLERKLRLLVMVKRSPYGSEHAVSDGGLELVTDAAYAAEPHTAERNSPCRWHRGRHRGQEYSVSMVIAGVHIRRAGERYDAAVAVIDGAALLDHTHIAAAAGEAESGQLSELYVRAHEVLRPHGSERIVVWPPDPPPGGRIRLKSTLATGRAEGAVLAAAGKLGVPSDVISGARVRAAGGGSTDEAVEQLCASIRGVPSDESVRRAIAAAHAWTLRSA